MNNPFSIDEWTDNLEERLQIAVVLYGENEIRLRVRFEIINEDNGIGWNDAGGHINFHSDPCNFIEDVESIHLMTETKESREKCRAHCQRHIDATEEEREELYKERYPTPEYKYDTITMNEDKESQLIEAICEAIQ